MAIVSSVQAVMKNGIQLRVTGLDGDSEESSVVDMEDFGIFPDKASATIKRTAGSTDTVDVDVEASNDGTNFTSILNITASTSKATSFVISKPARFFKIVVTTVGSGNTLTLDWLLMS